jgi:NDP-hexose 2,3-enoyl reductase
LTTKLDETTLAALDDIFPPIGKGGPSPAAWGW